MTEITSANTSNASDELEQLQSAMNKEAIDSVVAAKGNGASPAMVTHRIHLIPATDSQTIQMVRRKLLADKSCWTIWKRMLTLFPVEPNW